MSELRKEIHEYIDYLSENELKAIKPILTLLTNEHLIIETDLTDEEREIITAGMEEYKKGGFVPLESIVPRPKVDA